MMKKHIQSIIALGVAVLMISGFQVTSQEDITYNLENMIGIEEAYAGPCGRLGCETSEGDCGGRSHTVFNIGNLELERYCSGVYNSEKDQSIGSEEL